jgi:hypothetical protein
MYRIGIVAIAILTLTACMSADNMTTKAKERAHTYASDMGHKVVGLSCVGSDSDLDGYVSCDVRTNKEILNLECTYQARRTGCKTRMPKIQTNTQQ